MEVIATIIEFISKIVCKVLDIREHKIKTSDIEFSQKMTDYLSSKDSVAKEVTDYLSSKDSIAILKSQSNKLITNKSCRCIDRWVAIVMELLSLVSWYLTNYIYSLIVQTHELTLGASAVALVVLLLNLVSFSSFILFLPALLKGDISYIQAFCIWKGSYKRRKELKSIRNNTTVTEMEASLRRNNCNWTLVGMFNPNAENINDDYSHIMPNQWKFLVNNDREVWERMEVYVFGSTKYEAQRLTELFESLNINCFSLGGDSRDTSTRKLFFRRLEYLKLCGLGQSDGIPQYVDVKDLIQENEGDNADDYAEIVETGKWKIIINFNKDNNVKMYRLIRKSQIKTISEIKVKTLKNSTIEGNFLLIKSDSQSTRIPLDEVYRISDAV